MTDSSSNPTPFDLPWICQAANIRQIDFHPEIDSTNRQALALADLSETETPLLVLTDRQTEGRGRGSNAWWSAEGSLTFSLLMDRGGLATERTTLLSLTSGLAICQAIERFAPLADVGLKWPNDVYLEGRKLAGILVELPASQPPRLVVGVGINVNNRMQDAPIEFRQRATSLFDCVQQEQDLNDVLIGCLQELQRRFRDLLESDESLFDQWQAYHILHEQVVTVESTWGTLHGTCLGIDHDGALRIQTAAGIQRCLSGVVTEVRES